MNWVYDWITAPVTELALVLVVTCLLMHIWTRKRQCDLHCDNAIRKVRLDVVDIVTDLYDRIGDLEHALGDADVRVPHGREATERAERIEKGRKLLFPEEFL